MSVRDTGLMGCRVVIWDAKMILLTSRKQSPRNSADAAGLPPGFSLPPHPFRLVVMDISEP